MKRTRIFLFSALIAAASVGQFGLAAAQDGSELGQGADLFALHKVTASATPLTDETLASVVGSGSCTIGCVNLNLALLPQINTAVVTLVAVGRNISQNADARQINLGAIGQIIGR
jgi:hypothetical protein